MLFVLRSLSIFLTRWGGAVKLLFYLRLTASALKWFFFVFLCECICFWGIIFVVVKLLKQDKLVLYHTVRLSYATRWGVKLFCRFG